MEGLITINASGTRYVTNASTLRLNAPEGSSLWEIGTRKREREDEEVFVDRDGVLFGHILNVVRNRKVYSHRELGIGETIWADELAYFGLDTTPPQQPPSLDLKSTIQILTQEKLQTKIKNREIVDELLAWMLNQRPKKTFTFVGNTPSLVAPEGLPKNIFEIGSVFMSANRDLIAAIATSYGVVVEYLRTVDNFTPATLKYPNGIPPDLGKIHISINFP